MIFEPNYQNDQNSTMQNVISGSKMIQAVNYFLGRVEGWEKHGSTQCIFQLANKNTVYLICRVDSFPPVEKLSSAE